MAQMKFIHDQMEQERDYYFNKLRDVEILCQNEAVKEDALSKAVLKILYSVDSDSKNVLKEVRNNPKLRSVQHFLPCEDCDCLCLSLPYSSY